MTKSKPLTGIYFHYQTDDFVFQQRTKLKRSISGLFKREKKVLDSLHYVFCTDQYLLKLNRQHLNHDDYTDIISFGLSEHGQPMSGEIYISIDRVRENARTFRTSFQLELLRVIFHGALHLCGYKDKSPSDILIMRKMEDKYIRLYQQS